MRPGVGLDEIVRFNAERGVYGLGSVDDFVAERIESQLNEQQPRRLRIHPSMRVIEIRSARLPDGGIVTTYTDITQSVEAEETLAAANERLERRVRERTEELERLNQELARAKTEAEAANVSKTRFLAAASHDILAAAQRGAALRERAERGHRGGAPASRRSGAQRRRFAWRRWRSILAALLDISRLDAGATRPEIADFPIAPISVSCGSSLRRMARAKGLKLTFVASSLAVRSDPRSLCWRRLLRNLRSNAIKYTPHRPGADRRCRRHRGKFADGGLGHRHRHSPRKSRDRCSRSSSGSTPAPARRRASASAFPSSSAWARVLGHNVTVKSLPGKGSVFAVSAPVAAPPPQTPMRASAPAPTQRQSPLAGMAVVAIDNDPQIAEGMRALLSAWGCEPIVARSQREAMAKLAREKRIPDAVFADYHLDEGDGVDAIIALRWKFGPNLPGRPHHGRPFRRHAGARREKRRDGDQQAIKTGGAEGVAGAMALCRAGRSGRGRRSGSNLTMDVSRAKLDCTTGQNRER